jgi:YHS domain-containing protein
MNCSLNQENMSMNRRHFLMSTIAVSAAIALPSLAFAKKAAVYTGIVSGVGAGGYDVLSYRSGGPKKGSAAYAASYNGAKWYFSSAANMKAFQASPAKYAPAFGGYCAYAVANGVTAKGDPLLWKIVGGRLYLNLNKAAQSRWNADIPGNIASGNQNWPRVLN